MVWFTAAAVGVAEGRSGKVVALGEPADGDFLQVRPTGSKDVLSFSPTEVTLTKPPRAATPAQKSVAQPKTTTRKDSTVTQPSTVTSIATPSTPPSVVTSPAPSKTAAGSSADQSAGNAAAAKPAAAGAVAAGAAGAAAKPAKAPAARKTRTPEVTVTLTGTPDGEWSVDVVNGKKRTIRGLPVTSAAVAQAAKVLHPEVAEVVAGILEAARGVQQAKVAQLQAELEEARKLLEELSE
ncbi:DUF6319 family protein [Nocardia sp. NPDC005366]|uniref:DUF6319 family protein n=1 Tax=Nocardia sp. NPDC005366 TaxID=3156878 RepID=UPI0033BC1A3A